MSLLYHILNAIFPRLCFGCNKIVKKEDPFLCAECFSKIPIYQTLFCGLCYARMPDNKKICHKNSLYILGSATQYAHPVKKLIWELKYNKKIAAAKPLKKIVETYLDKLQLISPIGQISPIVIPIPLHPVKERQRGFNQSELIAETVSEKLNLPLVKNCLLKNKNTLPQMELDSREKREKNIVGSFSIKNPNLIVKKNILLIDDIVTSGSTLREAAKILKSAGAKKIIAITAAKAG